MPSSFGSLQSLAVLCATLAPPLTSALAPQPHPTLSAAASAHGCVCGLLLILPLLRCYPLQKPEQQLFICIRPGLPLLLRGFRRPRLRAERLRNLRGVRQGMPRRNARSAVRPTNLPGIVRSRHSRSLPDPGPRTLAPLASRSGAERRFSRHGRSCTAAGATGSDNAGDCTALRALFAAWGSAPAAWASGVTQGTSYCVWDPSSIVCDDYGRVTALLLSDYGLSGGIPASIAGLSALTSLDLSLNQLSSSIPASLAGLSPTLQSLCAEAPPRPAALPAACRPA